MKKLANLKGAKTLNREQQKEIFGGGDPVPHGDGQGGAGGLFVVVEVEFEF